MVFLNLLWVLLLIPIVTGPPATAALYAMAKRVYEEEVWELQETWQYLRELFWPSWRWALPNIVILFVLAGNFFIYQATEGVLWVVLRIIWGLLLILWVMLNLYFWPFWLAQEDKSIRTTYANCGRFLLLNPWPVLIITFICMLSLVVSVLLVLPLLVGAVSWLSLVGVTAVQRSLAQQKDDFS
jgi:uncharacterized membrane protein YesL